VRTVARESKRAAKTTSISSSGHPKTRDALKRQQYSVENRIRRGDLGKKNREEQEKEKTVRIKNNRTAGQGEKVAETQDIVD
jgi:hypothetical protein